MTLPASGAISISQVSVELGRASTATTSLGETATRSLAGVASGAIAFSTLYGKSASSAVIELYGPYNYMEAGTTTGFALYADGSIFGGVGTTGVSTGNKWITPQSGMSGYDARATVSSGTLTGGSGAGTWLNLGTTRNWYLSVAKGDAQYVTMLVQIRNATTLSVLDSATVQLGMDRTGGTVMTL